MKRIFRAIAAVLALGGAGAALAQPHIPGKVEIAFNRYYTYTELEGHIKAIAQAYPDLVELRNVGKSRQGRDLWVVIVNAPKTGPHTSKPAMYIEGNVHGNEIQAAEAVLYALWYLTKAYGQNDALTKLLDNYSFYLCISVNPDGREYWFEKANTSSSSRSNQRPVDSDRDGQFDEDAPDDLDGDGSITQMWKEVANGRWARDANDPRIFRRVGPEEKGGWEMLGSEGIDNDGDGLINEDGPGGDDMNRSYPGDWQPEYVQFGAGPYPFAHPETRGTGLFVLGRTNIAAVQSYHNSGGMILRGPGANYNEGMYGFQDIAVYDEIMRTGEQMLPYYRAMVTYRDLYTVHGGQKDWTAETLGIFSFTNEMMHPGMYFQRDVTNPDEKAMWLFRDRLLFGQVFKDYTEYDHPQYGKVLVGGLNKWSSRNTPTFMLEEECHRNFAFTMYHADQMPLLRFDRTEIAKAGPGLWTITLEVRNDKLMPTRSGIARSRKIGTNDLFFCEPGAGAAVVSSGQIGSWTDRQISPVRFEPGRIQVEGGVPGRGAIIYRFYISGKEGDPVTFRYQSEKARTIEKTIELK